MPRVLQRGLFRGMQSVPALTIPTPAHWRFLCQVEVLKRNPPTQRNHADCQDEWPRFASPFYSASPWAAPGSPPMGAAGQSILAGLGPSGLCLVRWRWHFRLHLGIGLRAVVPYHGHRRPFQQETSLSPRRKYVLSMKQNALQFGKPVHLHVLLKPMTTMRSFCRLLT